MGSAVHLKPVTRYYSSADLSFLFLIAQILVASQNLYDGKCLHDLSIHICCWNFRYINLNIIIIDNTVTPHLHNFLFLI